jgi:hypothetical protein
MSEENPQSPFGWSQRYASAQARVEESKSLAPVNAERQALIHRKEAARDLDAGKISKAEYEHIVADIDSHLNAILAESMTEPEPVESPESVARQRRELVDAMRARQEAAAEAERAAAEAKAKTQAEQDLPEDDVARQFVTEGDDAKVSSDPDADADVLMEEEDQDSEGAGEEEVEESSDQTDQSSKRSRGRPRKNR